MLNKNRLLIILVASIVTLCTNSTADNVAPSQKPPNNLSVSNVPQFVIFGYDDQESTEGMQAVLDIFKARKNPQGIDQKETFDGTPLRCSFYTTGKYLNSSELIALHKKALADSFEIGNHTNEHATGLTTSEATWKNEMQICNDALISAGIPKSKIYGFRTPFLEYNNATFKAIKSMGFIYDCSIEEGCERNQSIGVYFWPHTLDNGSPGNKAATEEPNPNPPLELLTSYPGIWEIPCYYLVLPADSLCVKYGISKGLRKRTYNNINYFDTVSGKLTGLDYNLIEEAKVTDKEFVGIVKYNLDMAYKGNRAPLTLGSHSNYYSDPTWASVLKQIIDYSLTLADVRIIPAINLIQWMRNPKGLSPTPVCQPAVKNNSGTFRIKSLSRRTFEISGLSPGTYEIALYTASGKKIMSVSKQIFTGLTSSQNSILYTPDASSGFVIVSIKNSAVKLIRKVSLVD